MNRARRVLLKIGRLRGLGPGALMLLLAIAFTGCDYARMYDQDAIKTYKGK